MHTAQTVYFADSENGHNVEQLRTRSANRSWNKTSTSDKINNVESHC